MIMIKPVIFTWDDKSTTVPDVSSGDGIIRTHEQCLAWAEAHNCTLRFPAQDELFIDIDTEEQFSQFNALYGLLVKHFGATGWLASPSKQGLPHQHIVVKMSTRLPELVRVALQACVGSDPARELLTLRRSMDLEENAVIFFEPILSCHVTAQSEKKT